MDQPIAGQEYQSDSWYKATLPFDQLVVELKPIEWPAALIHVPLFNT